MTERSAPGFFQHLWLLWGLRVRIGLNGGKKRSRLLAVAAYLGSSAPAPFLLVGFYELLRHEQVAHSYVWPDFLLELLCFVTTCTFCAWPVLSAGVDDHSELSRYNAFPISSFRLLVASTLSSQLEPRSLVLYAPVVGASLGYLSSHPPKSWALASSLFAAFVLFNAALSRVLLHVALNVLRQKRSAELIGGFFVLVLVACSFIPPIDTSWLLAAGGAVTAVPDTLLEDATVALSRVPPGWLGAGLRALTQGDFVRALTHLFNLVQLTLIALAVAFGLLLHFHRQGGRAAAFARGTANPFATSSSLFRTLLAREALDLWHNPKALLLASVPFLLAILLKLLSGRDLFVYLLGASADAWLMGALCLYGAVVISSTFSQNTFAYDGHGFSVFLSAPVPLAQVLKAKNLVHAAAALVLGTAVAVFYLVYFGKGGAKELCLSLAAVATVVPVLLSAGNFLSLYFPVKFHASLKRRDKLPLVVAALGVLAASIGVAPFAWALKWQGRQGPTWSTVAIVGCCGVLAAVGYRALLPAAVKRLYERREWVLRAVTRE